MSVQKSVLAGTIDGVAGGIALAAVMAAARRANLVHNPLPLAVERKAEAQLGFAAKTNSRQEIGLALGEHMLLSAGFGALFGLLKSFLRFPLLLGGALFGLASTP